MFRMILFLSAMLFFCGCATPEQQNRDPVRQTSSAPKSISSGGKTADAAKKTTEKKQARSRRSVSGTFSGDADVSDDF